MCQGRTCLGWGPEWSKSSVAVGRAMGGGRVSPGAVDLLWPSPCRGCCLPLRRCVGCQHPPSSSSSSTYFAAVHGVLSSAYLLPRGYVNGCVILISYPHLTGFWQVFVILILTSARGILTSAFWKAGCVCVLMCAILILGSAFQLLRWGDRFLFVRSLWFLHWDLQG